jgi:4-diphosphocytidyl-2C-methyl-D-erythritol kinase
MIREVAPAKINLFLHVGPVRADGLHGQVESANKMRPLRREMARIQTLLREKGVRN